MRGNMTDSAHQGQWVQLCFGYEANTPSCKVNQYLLSDARSHDMHLIQLHAAVKPTKTPKSKSTQSKVCSTTAVLSNEIIMSCLKSCWVSFYISKG